jgi:protease-4
LANQPLSPQDRKLRENTILSLYDDFVSKVASGRGMKEDDVREVAQGRVWTGTDGLDKKLVDEIGGIERAIALAKQQAKIPADEEVEIVEFPNPKFIDLNQFVPSIISVDASTELLKEMSETLTKMKNDSGKYLYTLPYDTYESLKDILYNFNQK